MFSPEFRRNFFCLILGQFRLNSGNFRLNSGNFRLNSGNFRLNSGNLECFFRLNFCRVSHEFRQLQATFAWSVLNSDNFRLNSGEFRQLSPEFRQLGCFFRLNFCRVSPEFRQLQATFAWSVLNSGNFRLTSGEFRQLSPEFRRKKRRFLLISLAVKFCDLFDFLRFEASGNVNSEILSSDSELAFYCFDELLSFRMF